MVDLYLPPSLRHFDPIRVLPRARTGSMALEYDLVEALRPSLLVDVGAGDAQSYFILCQSVREHDVDCLCYAVDEWAEAEDEVKAPDDESQFKFVNHFAHGHMRGFCYLMQMSPPDALMHFDESMIDVLRVDPARAGASAADAFGHWAPRVAPGGVLLCPGTRGDGGEQRVAALAEATPGWSRFHLEHGSGGVIARRPRDDDPPAEPADLVRIAFFGSDEDRASLARFYAHAAQHVTKRGPVLAARWGLGVKKNARKA